ncbi:type III polyketide synthase [Brevundimonas lutea]|uniref:type III polyketide synthase n=1 Tax=Brevundimonas lutea TaxID=2293980 RepID=UPI000F02B85E|nr:type III polyketide synthase [Brevundimonas lutea]
MTPHLNRISTATPPHDVHEAFVAFATHKLASTRSLPLFRRLASRSQIDHRWSVLATEGPGERVSDVYVEGQFPTTARRMALYEAHATDLAEKAVRGLAIEDLSSITHVVITCCTGLSAPGIDLQLVDRLGLDPTVERTVIGFMGCYAAVNALKLARHTVRSEPSAKVLVVSLELCTLHLQDTLDLEEMLSFLIFGDGCAAALVSAEPVGLALDGFKAVTAAGTADQITWSIGDQGFNMVLSGRVPGSVGAALRDHRDSLFGPEGTVAISLWAIHPGGRTVLDAVQSALGLSDEAMAPSREVLRAYGNMSSATLLFVLDRVMASARPGERGCAMAFGPGLTAETMMFSGAA